MDHPRLGAESRTTSEKILPVIAGTSEQPIFYYILLLQVKYHTSFGVKEQRKRPFYLSPSSILFRSTFCAASLY